MMSIRRAAIFIAMTILVVGAFLPIIAHAAYGFPDRIVPAACTGKNAATECTFCSLGTLANNIVQLAIFLYIIFMAVRFFWAGLRYLTSQGNIQAVVIARNTLRDVFIGLLFVLGAWLIVNFFMSFVISHEFSNVFTWNRFCK